MKRMCLVLCLLISTGSAGWAADAQPAPTPKAPSSAAYPSTDLFPDLSPGRVAAGAGLAIMAALPFDRNVQRHFAPDKDTTSTKNFRKLGDAGQVAGPVIGTAFLLQGIAFENPRSKETGILTYESFIVAGIFEGALKFVVGRKRPSTTTEPFKFSPLSGNASFPSGHTTEAFAGATVFAEQYPHWYVAVPAYAAASAVGLSRLRANQHWLSDVVAGAFLGSGTSHFLRLHRKKKADETAWHLEPDLNGIRLVRKF